MFNKKQIIIAFLVLITLPLFAGQNNNTPGLRNPEPISNLSTLGSGNFFKIKTGILGGVSHYFVSSNKIVLNNNNVPQYNLSVDNAELGIHFGVFSQLSLGPIVLRPEITFNSNVINYKLDDLSNSSASQILKERYQYLDIPILIGYKNGGLRFNAGPVGHIFISNKSNLIDINQFTTDFKALTLGYQAGLAFDFYNLMFDLRYEGNFSKLGAGILFQGQKINFDRNPGRIMASISFAIK